jgi:hypothetical protein
MLVALASAAAVVIAALITKNEPLPSAPPLTQMQPITEVNSLLSPQGNLMFDENFDDGIANGIAIANTRWGIIDDNNGGKLFQLDNMSGSDWIGFTLATISIGNGTLEYKVNLDNYSNYSGAIACHFRSTSDNRYVFGLAADTNSISINYQGTDTNNLWRPLDNAVVAFIVKKNTWFEVRIDFYGDEITSYLDEKELLSTADSRLKTGGIDCAVAPRTIAQFDDLRVWSQP